MATPSAPKRKMDPAWEGDMPSSLEIEGIKGANINRLIKERKKRRVRKAIVPNTELKRSGVGQVFSAMETPLSFTA